MSHQSDDTEQATQDLSAQSDAEKSRATEPLAAKQPAAPTPVQGENPQKKKTAPPLEKKRVIQTEGGGHPYEPKAPSPWDNSSEFPMPAHAATEADETRSPAFNRGQAPSADRHDTTQTEGMLTDPRESRPTPSAGSVRSNDTAGDPSHAAQPPPSAKSPLPKVIVASDANAQAQPAPRPQVSGSSVPPQESEKAIGSERTTLPRIMVGDTPPREPSQRSTVRRPARAPQDRPVAPPPPRQEKSRTAPPSAAVPPTQAARPAQSPSPRSQRTSAPRPAQPETQRMAPQEPAPTETVSSTQRASRQQAPPTTTQSRAPQQPRRTQSSSAPSRESRQQAPAPTIQSMAPQQPRRNPSAASPRRGHPPDLPSQRSGAAEARTVRRTAEEGQRRGGPRAPVLRTEAPPSKQAESTPFAVKKPHTFLKGMATLGMLVLFEAIAIPLLSPDMHLIAPWTLIRSVDSVTFQASVSLGALLVFTAIPLPYIVRATLLLCTGITMLVFGILHVQDASSAFAFRGHPGLAYVLTEQPAALAMTLGGLLFPTMLYWRSRYTASFSSRIAVLIGMLAMMACYFLVGAIGDLTSATPIVELARTVTNSDSLLANRLSAFALLVPLGVIPFATLIFLKHPRTGGAGFWAWLSVSSLAAVPLIQALFVSSWREGQWKYVLEPLQASLFLYAGLLLAPVALGHVIGEVERLIVLAKFKARHRRASAT